MDTSCHGIGVSWELLLWRNCFSFGFVVLPAKGSPAEPTSNPRAPWVLCYVTAVDVLAGRKGRLWNGETFYCRTEGKWRDSQKGKMYGPSKLWSGSAERTGRVCDLTHTGQWLSQAQSCAGKPQEKREVHCPVLLEFWALERPKEQFNANRSWFWNSLEREETLQNLQKKSEVWNWLSLEVVETDSISLFKKG